MTPERRAKLEAHYRRHAVLLAYLSQEQHVPRRGKVILVKDLGQHEAGAIQRQLLEHADALQRAWAARELLDGGAPVMRKPETWLRERPLMVALRRVVARTVPGATRGHGAPTIG